jgi:N-methylhydantoinase A
VWWRETREVVPSDIYRGDAIPTGAVLEGPALIESAGTTIAIHPGQRASVDRYGNTIIESMEERHDGGRPGHL